jgi:hypothetical protein
VQLITKRCFRTFAPKAGNGFVAPENCFVAGGRTKQFLEKINDFNVMKVARAGLFGVVQ